MEMLNADSLSRLKEQLVSQPWPDVYMFKMIFPANNRTYALIRNIFPEEARFFDKHSSKGKYVSITVKELMLSADEVIDRYRKVAEIDGVIML
jgi:uncharacterized protein